LVMGRNQKARSPQGWTPYRATTLLVHAMRTTGYFWFSLLSIPG
jgi:hypothetical protein